MLPPTIWAHPVGAPRAPAAGSTHVSADERGTGARHQRAPTPVSRCWDRARAGRCDFHHTGFRAGGFIIAVLTYGWLRRICGPTRLPPDRRAGADGRRRAFGVPG